MCVCVSLVVVVVVVRGGVDWGGQDAHPGVKSTICTVCVGWQGSVLSTDGLFQAVKTIYSREAR